VDIGLCKRNAGIAAAAVAAAVAGDDDDATATQPQDIRLCNRIVLDTQLMKCCGH